MFPQCAPSCSSCLPAVRGLRSGEARLRPAHRVLSGHHGLSVSDPVSWLLIEPGWEVVDAAGEKVGTVHEVIGDTGADIFDGLAVSPGLLKSSKYVPAERVVGIVEGQVRLDLSAEEFERLGEHGEQPPSAQIRADTTDIRPEP
jgi:hypothetical protein